MLKSKAINRRSFVKSAAAGATLGTTALASPAISSDTFSWKMVTTWPKNFPGLGVGAENLAKLITKLSNNRIKVI